MNAVVNVRDYRQPDGKIVLPEGVAYIGRSVPGVISGSPFYNGYRIGPTTSRWLAIELFRLKEAEVLRRYPDHLDSLRGKTLACWCAPLPCHGDVIAAFLAEREPVLSA